MTGIAAALMADFAAAFQIVPLVALTFVGMAFAAFLWATCLPRVAWTHILILWIGGTVFFTTLALSRAITSETSHWGVWVAAGVMWTWYVAVAAVSVWTWRRVRGRVRHG